MNISKLTIGKTILENPNEKAVESAMTAVKGHFHLATPKHYAVPSEPSKIVSNPLGSNEPGKIWSKGSIIKNFKPTKENIAANSILEQMKPIHGNHINYTA